ncbi:hypothetical protein [Plantactinospora sp. KLBMP9567]|uniref:hypothetical protein n=1 Tax=Plantactinospora sp. KLBMP9567 TaxID=3085900 RepID=UPI0029817F4A|nr:hypothetical protein [Plantactinospora sp. KLBMP9567]MDW5329464.1 hypothetical protein [Plantactinospora sp. KLBMP9567]
MELVRHVRSDWVLRNRHEELSVLIGELGFIKRGSRIVTGPNELPPPSWSF